MKLFKNKMYYSYLIMIILIIVIKQLLALAYSKIYDQYLCP